MQGSCEVHLAKEGWQVFFVRQHHRFLPLDHPFKRDIKNFRKGVQVTDPAPQMMTGAEVHAEIEALKIDKEKGGLLDMVRNTFGLIYRA
jgi:hypothetical protein